MNENEAKEQACQALLNAGYHEPECNEAISNFIDGYLVFTAAKKDSNKTNPLVYLHDGQTEVFSDCKAMAQNLSNRRFHSDSTRNEPESALAEYSFGYLGRLEQHLKRLSGRHLFVEIALLAMVGGIVTWLLAGLFVKDNSGIGWNTAFVFSLLIVAGFFFSCLLLHFGWDILAGSWVRIYKEEARKIMDELLCLKQFEQLTNQELNETIPVHWQIHQSDLKQLCKDESDRNGIAALFAQWKEKLMDAEPNELPVGWLKQQVLEMEFQDKNDRKRVLEFLEESPLHNQLRLRLILDIEKFGGYYSRWKRNSFNDTEKKLNEIHEISLKIFAGSRPRNTDAANFSASYS